MAIELMFPIVPLAGQTVSGSIAGTVVDSSGSSVPHATLSLVQDGTGIHSGGKTGAQGDFVLSAVLPGRYTLFVEAPGFKKLEQRNLNVTDGERLVAGRLQLEAGAIAESVTVPAQGMAVETQSRTSRFMRKRPFSSGGRCTTLLIACPSTSWIRPRALARRARR